ncbi:hypothetical protein [Arthrobacter burdickii]|uniref:Uncharacterized protein n=1 Tax=Arthrobacter burdickii TaxID=3035920 RepID=A0ABT8K4K9_9MICC|nr:hypothetical protein [Arthrobacter burdickii]MDN4611938.1 hypothetical protein [Arthrobacter burdickii]
MGQTTLQPGERVATANVAAPKYEALLERLNTPRPDQSMGPDTFEELCRRAWEALPGSTPWADVPEQVGRAEYREEVRGILTVAANLMPIDTLHGADGASVWLRGER